METISHCDLAMAIFPKYRHRQAPSSQMIRILANRFYDLGLRAGMTAATRRGFWNAVEACIERGWIRRDDYKLTRLGLIALTFYSATGIRNERQCYADRPKGNGKARGRNKRTHERDDAVGLAHPEAVAD